MSARSEADRSRRETRTDLAQQLATQDTVAQTALLPVDRLKAITEPYKQEVARALPKGWDAERFLRILQTVCRTNPRLLEADPVTLIAGMMQLAQLGLTPGVNGYLVPYNTRRGLEVQVIIGYKGTVELVRRSGAVAKITTAVVREGDNFGVVLGSEPKVTHIPLLTSTEDRAATHFYAIAWYAATGEWDVEVMDAAQVDSIMRRSKSSKPKVADTGRYVATDGPWSTDYDEMGRKTVLLRFAKRLPMSDEDRRALAVDETVKRTIDPRMLDVSDSSDTNDLFQGEVFDDATIIGVDEGIVGEDVTICEQRREDICAECDTTAETCIDDRGPLS